MRRMAPRRGFGLERRRVLIDAGGARRRSEERDRAWDAEIKAEQEDRERVVKAAGKIPVLRSVATVAAHATEIKHFMSNGRRISFPALQIAKNLSIDDVFKALPQNYGQPNTPNIKATRRGEPSVGPHFDNYSMYPNFRPWTLHENHSGTGVIRATFLPDAQFDAYKALALSLPEGDATEEFLAETRSAMGKLAIESTHESHIFTGRLKPGTRTLLWNGGGGTPPAIHDIQRDQPGDYTVYAVQAHGDLPSGFEPIG